MSIPQDDFANRCLPVLRTAIVELQVPDEGRDEVVRRLIAGAWLTFETQRAQREREIAGTVGRANRMPPFVEEVQEYLNLIEYPIDAQHFIDFYQTRGWKISKGVPMKDWKSALRNWKRENWGYRPDRPKVTNQRPQMASLGALQIQLEKVRQDIANIVRPGGSAHPRLASSISPEEMKRYTDLLAQRDGLLKRINEFSQ